MPTAAGSTLLLVLLQYDNHLPVVEPRDPTLDVLLDLDGQVHVVDPDGGHWVRFVVTRVPVSPEKPHGIDYSLTLHGPDGDPPSLSSRLASEGMAACHPKPRQGRRVVLRERGVIP